MSSNVKQFGHFKPITGKDGTYPSTEVPLDLIRSVQQRPIPATVSGSNNVTFTIIATEASPVPVWIGNDFVLLKESLAYTWGAVSNAILDSTGAAATDADSVLGIWYMYMGFDDSTTPASLVLRPSQTAPSNTGNYPAGVLGHPGTAASQFWRYVGFMRCTTAATPAFQAQVKSGFWWKFAPVSYVIITDAWTGPTAPGLAIPKLAKYGLEIGGTLETGADGQIFIGSHTASTIWDAELDISEATASNVAQQILQSPVTFSPNDTTSPFYAIAAPAGDFHLLRIKDVV